MSYINGTFKRLSISTGLLMTGKLVKIEHGRLKFYYILRVGLQEELRGELRVELLVMFSVLSR